MTRWVCFLLRWSVRARWRAVSCSCAAETPPSRRPCTSRNWPTSSADIFLLQATCKLLLDVRSVPQFCLAVGSKPLPRTCFFLGYSITYSQDANKWTTLATSWKFLNTCHSNHSECIDYTAFTILSQIWHGPFTSVRADLVLKVTRHVMNCFAQDNTVTAVFTVLY